MDTGHERNAMELPPPVLAEKVSSTSVLLGILIGHQRIEDGHDLAARLVHDRRRNNEDEIVATDVADKPCLRTIPFTTSCRIFARMRITRSPS
jgi:hypothetical protein